ncbi:MAG: hypothetical protein JO280_05280 [Mycobacteriaceae bacterium]|nr:hypothetical protein [Mycobacteriaceae bacterium]
MAEFYLWGWLATTVLTFWLAHKFAEDRSAPPLDAVAVVSLIAGALWPVLAVGIVELGSLVTYAKLHH